MTEPNDLELTLLQKFREIICDLELKDDEKTDIQLLRWLRARDLNLDKANLMLRRSYEWKIENDIYTILKWNAPKELWDEFYYEICGMDNSGCPVLTIQVGLWEVRKVCESHLRESFLRYIDLMFARAEEQFQKNSQQLGKPITQLVLIIDSAKFSMRQLTSFTTASTIREVAQRFEANYPEILKKCFIVNASRVFQVFYALVKPLLTARTLSKVKIFGADEYEWKLALLEQIPADQLSKSLGGTYIPPSTTSTLPSSPSTSSSASTSPSTSPSFK